MVKSNRVIHMRHIETHCSNDYLDFGFSTSYPPLESQPIHTHDKCEIFWLVQGSGHYMIEDTLHILEPGKVFIMRPGESHRAVCTDTEPYTRMTLHFSPSLVDSIDPDRLLLRTFYDRPLGLRNSYTPDQLSGTHIFENFRRMQIPVENSQAYCVKVLSLLYPVLLDLGEVFDNGIANSPTEINQKTHDMIEFINQNITEELSVELLCSKFYVSTTQLYRNFKKATDMNVWNYIQLKRLVLAHSYIQDGMSSQDAAQASGFNDYSAFYRAYKKKYGVSPSGRNRKL